MRKFYFPDTTIGAKLTLDANDGIKSMREFKQQIAEARGDLVTMTEKFGATSSEAQLAAKRVAELTDAMGDAKNLADAFNPDQKFRALSQSLNGVLGGFTAITGAMGLLGIESEGVQRQLLRVQSALALSQGLNQLGEAITSFKTLATIIKTNVVAAFNAMKIAIGSTGIGLIVVALGALVAGFAKLRSEIGGVTEEQKKNLEVAQEGVKNEKNKLELLDSQDNTLRLQGKSEKEILQSKIAQIKVLIEANKQEIERRRAILQTQIEAEKNSKRILKSIVDILTLPITGLSKLLGLITGKKLPTVGELFAGSIFDPAAVEKEGKDAIAALEKENVNLQNRIDGIVLSINQKREKAGVTEDQFKITKPDQDPAVLAEKQKADIILETRSVLTQKTIDLSNIQKDIEIGNLKQIAYTEEQTAQARIAAAQSVGNALGALSDLVGRQTAAGKALGIAQATINTWIGVTEVLRNKTTLPEPFGTINKVASIATIIASGLTAVKNIVKTQVPGGGGGSSPSFGTPAPLQPQLAFSNTRLDRNQLNQIGNATVRAFVVETDVTNNQERIRRLNRAARI